MINRDTFLAPMNQKSAQQEKKERDIKGSLVLALCNCLACARGYKLPQSHCGDSRDDTLFSWFSAIA